MRRTAPRAHPPQLLGAERRRHRRSSARVRRGADGNGPSPGVDEHVHLVPERREPLGHRRDMDRPARRAGHGLVDGGVEDLHRSDAERLPIPIWPALSFVFTSSAKNGPDVMRPKSSRSSFIANDSAAQRARRSSGCWRSAPWPRSAPRGPRARRRRPALTPGCHARAPRASPSRARPSRIRMFSTKPPTIGV